MHSIAASSTASNATSLPTPPVSDSAGSGAGPGSDLLAAMNPAMDAAFAVGRPTNGSGAAAILATTGAYVAGAQATITKLDEGIRRREHEIAELPVTDPQAATKKQQDLDMLTALRDRIQLSIERVSRSAAGGDSEGGGEVESLDKAAATSKRRRRDEDEALLEQRRRLIAPTSIDVAPGVNQVVSAYSTTKQPA